MIKMVNGGITVEVWPAEVDFYKRAGYKVVIDVPASPPVAKEVESQTPEEANAESVAALSASKGAPKATKK